jgi:hypothetical protein
MADSRFRRSITKCQWFHFPVTTDAEMQVSLVAIGDDGKPLQCSNVKMCEKWHGPNMHCFFKAHGSPNAPVSYVRSTKCQCWYICTLTKVWIGFKGHECEYVNGMCPHMGEEFLDKEHFYRSYPKGSAASSRSKVAQAIYEDVVKEGDGPLFYKGMTVPKYAQSSEDWQITYASRVTKLPDGFVVRDQGFARRIPMKPKRQCKKKKKEDSTDDDDDDVDEEESEEDDDDDEGDDLSLTTNAVVEELSRPKTPELISEVTGQESITGGDKKKSRKSTGSMGPPLPRQTGKLTRSAALESLEGIPMNMDSIFQNIKMAKQLRNECYETAKENLDMFAALSTRITELTEKATAHAKFWEGVFSVKDIKF